MKVGLYAAGSRNGEEVENGDSRAAEKASNRDHVVINLNNESPKAEKVCRICHLDSSGPGQELIPLGCDCRGELGLSHHNCAEAWFSQKGNRSLFLSLNHHSDRIYPMPIFFLPDLNLVTFYKLIPYFYQFTAHVDEYIKPFPHKINIIQTNFLCINLLFYLKIIFKD